MISILRKLTLLTVLIVALITSCQKHDPPPEGVQTRVKSAQDDDAHINYTYDSKWRLIKYDAYSNADTTLREYVYTDTAVAVKNYHGNKIYLGTTIYRLNSQGLAISMIDSSTSTYHTYTYNSSNQVVRLQVTRTPVGATYNWDNKYFYNSNGNLDSSNVFVSNNGLTTSTYYTQYDLNNANTIGNENTGLSFLGASTKHPLTQTTTSNGTVLFNYTYQYDSRGRVANQETKIGDVSYSSYTFTYH